MVQASAAHPGIPDFPSWLEANPGIAVLACAAGCEGALPGPLRLAATPGGGAVALARVCDAGPECVAATVQDWAGGYRISFSAHGAFAGAAMPPMHAEATVLAALRAMSSRFAERGYPAPLLSFAPGGERHSDGFHPLLPTGLSVDAETAGAMVLAAQAAADAGAARIAPAAVLPDLWKNGLPVYDLRLRRAELSAVLEMHSGDPDKVEALLVERGCLGGQNHFLLVDGVGLEAFHVTWMKAPGGSVAQDVWPRGGASVQAAPEFMRLREPGPAGRLN